MAPPCWYVRSVSGGTCELTGGCAGQQVAAAYSGATPNVEWLLEHGASIDQPNIDGLTALMACVIQGQTSFGTPGTNDSQEGSTRVAESLIARGAQIDHPEADHGHGRTALIWAARKNRINHANLLLEHGAKVNGADSDGRTPLMYAVAAGHATIAELLLKHGADAGALTMHICVC